MITWMQRHKKYLVITIWISVIAFVGAGFVGWGAYDFNSDRATAVAKVEKRKISVQEFQLAYANYYNFYNNMLEGKLTKEKANQMGLEKIVMENVINEAIILSYADEIGLQVTDEEIKDKIANDDAFKQDGAFDKDTYYRVIKGSGISAKDYEKSLKKQLLLTKLQDVFKLKPTVSEVDLFKAAMFMQDRLSVDTIQLDPNEAKVTDEEAKKYWDEHKTDYLTDKSYSLDVIKIALGNEDLDEAKLKEFFDEKKYNYRDSAGKLLDFEVAKPTLIKDFRLKEKKREALESYLLFKKSQMSATTSMEVNENDATFPTEKLVNAQIGEVLKPIETADGYLVVKITNINHPVPQSFADAKEAVMKAVGAIKETEVLQKKAEARLNLFQGKDIGFISRDSTVQIADLDEAESLEFINFVFDNKKMRNFTLIGNKAVLYQIMEQTLLRKDKAEKYTELVNENIIQMKNAELNKNLVNGLRKRYDIEQYYKGN